MDEKVQLALTIARNISVCETKAKPDTVLYTVHGGFEAYKALLRFQELEANTNG